MKIQKVSDLHIEFDSRANTRYDLPVTDADVIVLAGDIGVGYEMESEFCKDLAQKHGKPVLFVLGNHSFYHHNMDNVRQKWYDNDLSGDGVQFLDDGLMFVKDDTTFVGGIFWTDFQDYKHDVMDYANHSMNDFRFGTMSKPDTLLTCGEADKMNEYHLTPCRSVDEHIRTKNWINLVLKDFKSNKNVVITHHAPSYRSVSPLYAGDMLNAAFASTLDEWIESKPIDLWLHGHMHNSSNYIIGDTVVACNPRGYYPRNLNQKFDPGLVIEV